MRHLLLSAQAWWDAQRFDQPTWQVASWRDQKARHIHLHVAKALGKVVAALDEAAPLTSDTALQRRVRDEALPDLAIYRSQLINLLPDGCEWSPSLSPATPGVSLQADTEWRHAVLSLSRASAALAAYLEPREHGEASPASHLRQAIEQLHASAAALAAAFGVDPVRAHQARLEALLGASLPAALTDDTTTVP